MEKINAANKKRFGDHGKTWRRGLIDFSIYREEDIGGILGFRADITYDSEVT